MQIKNFRSVDDISFEISKLADSSYTYGLIGINEAGKSSILKAIALKDGLIPLTEKDFIDKKKPVEIFFNYEATLEDSKVYEDELADIKNIDGAGSSSLGALASTISTMLGLGSKISISYTFTLSSISKPVVEISTPSQQEPLPIYKKHILDNVHKAIFWTAEDRFLISQPIDLDRFADDPNLSIPLQNCFSLAGIDDIKSCVSSLSDSTDKEYLVEQLGETVTAHIKAAWPNHPIKITFDIDNSIINFHVRDSDAIGGKAKTVDQRSDGFKQFISFLLTVSAQSKNELLQNAILLLDEPETHLHPQAQEFLLDELVKITSNGRNNIVFFATHSNYMVDKKDLSRNYKVEKVGGKTIKERFNNSVSTYASVNYVVFNVPSSDYHNELYGMLHEKFQDADSADKERTKLSCFDQHLKSGSAGKIVPLDRPNTRNGNANEATLPTYIRNCIHHPENKYEFTKKELVESIELLRALK
jgi:predicted ATP-dependent endonuclease of OLD family